LEDASKELNAKTYEIIVEKEEVLNH